MKSVVQVTGAIRSIKEQEDFHFAQKSTLTHLVMVSWGGSSVLGGASSDSMMVSWGRSSGTSGAAPTALRCLAGVQRTGFVPDAGLHSRESVKARVDLS